MKNLFESACGTIPGRLHQLAQKNNQDAAIVIERDNYIIALVADGCSAEPTSEVGAYLGTRLLLSSLEKKLSSDPTIRPDLLATVQSELLFHLRSVVSSLSGDARAIIKQSFLFTVVGAIITPTHTGIFSLGDGVIIINNVVTTLGPFRNNEPPYLGYRLLKPLWVYQPEAPTLDFISVVETTSVQSLLIGTDGVSNLIQSAQKKLPGRPDEVVGPIEQFWLEDKYFLNPDMLRRRLYLLNRERDLLVKNETGAAEIRREVGLLPDDTTLIVLRRKKTSDGGLNGTNYKQ